MFLKSQLSWEVSVPPSKFDTDASKLQRAILINLLDDFATKKASKDIGYLLAVSTLDKIGQGIFSHTGDVVFPVDFTCVSFKILTGEVLDGIVDKVMKHGVFLTCGPADKVYLSHQKMQEGYKFVPEETLFFKKDGSEIRRGTKVRFSVIAERYDDAQREFQVIVRSNSDGLGPMS